MFHTPGVKFLLLFQNTYPFLGCMTMALGFSAKSCMIDTLPSASIAPIYPAVPVKPMYSKAEKYNSCELGS